MRRPLVSLHLPLEMDAAARIMNAVAREYPDAVIEATGASFHLVADDDHSLSREARRRLARDRSRAVRAANAANEQEATGG